MLKCGFSVFTSIAGAGFIAFNSFSILVRATIDVIYQEKIFSDNFFPWRNAPKSVVDNNKVKCIE